MKYLDLAYRWVGTTLFWIFFGLIGLLMGFIVIPIVYLLVRDTDKRQVTARNLIGAAFSLFVWTACRSRLISIDVSGMEHVDPDGGQLILKLSQFFSLFGRAHPVRLFPGSGS